MSTLRRGAGFSTRCLAVLFVSVVLVVAGTSCSSGAGEEDALDLSGLDLGPDQTPDTSLPDVTSDFVWPDQGTEPFDADLSEPYEVSVCQDPGVPNAPARPRWGQVVGTDDPCEYGGSPLIYPDYENISHNLDLASIKEIASALTRTAKELDTKAEQYEDFTPDDLLTLMDAQGECVCRNCDLGTAVANVWDAVSAGVNTLLKGCSCSGAASLPPCSDVGQASCVDLPPVAQFLRTLLDEVLSLFLDHAKALKEQLESDLQQTLANQVRPHLQAALQTAILECLNSNGGSIDWGNVVTVCGTTQLEWHFEELARVVAVELATMWQTLQSTLEVVTDTVHGVPSLIERSLILWNKLKEIDSISEIMGGVNYKEIVDLFNDIKDDCMQYYEDLSDAVDQVKTQFQSSSAAIKAAVQTHIVDTYDNLLDCSQSLATGVDINTCVATFEAAANSELNYWEAELNADNDGNGTPDIFDPLIDELDQFLADVKVLVEVDGQPPLSKVEQYLDDAVVNRVEQVLYGGMEGCYTRGTAAECEAFCASYGGSLCWVPSDVFKDPKKIVEDPSNAAAAGLFILKQIGWLDEFSQKVDDILNSAGGALSSVADVMGSIAKVINAVLEFLQVYVDRFTEGYHLGAYNPERADLHHCIGYAGHGAFAQLLGMDGGNVRIGARYTSHNLSKRNRFQLRTGGFAVTAWGKTLSLAPTPEFNFQIDGWKLWSKSHPFGMNAEPTDPALFREHDVFHLLEQTEAQNLISSGLSHLVCDLYPTKFQADGQTSWWPRVNNLSGTEAEVFAARAPFDGSSTAVVSAGLNLPLRFPTVEEEGDPDYYSKSFSIPIFASPPTSITAILELTFKAGMDWLHDANNMRDRLVEMINANLLPQDQLTAESFFRDDEDFQAPDLTADNGQSVFVEPGFRLGLEAGFKVWKIFFGIHASLGLSVKLEPGGVGGVVDLNAATADLITASNPDPSAPCDPVYSQTTHSECSNESYFDAEGKPLSTGDYACTPLESEGSCCITLKCDPNSACFKIMLEAQLENPLTLCVDEWVGLDKETCLDVGKLYPKLRKLITKFVPIPNVQEAILHVLDANANLEAKWNEKACSEESCPGAKFTTAGLDVSGLSQCETYGYCLDQKDNLLAHDVQIAECEGQEDDSLHGHWVPYACHTVTEETFEGWTGTGCSPLQHGYQSACGCEDDSDCAGEETCNTSAGRCVGAAGEALSCLCNEAGGFGCPDGRECVQGACLKPCVDATDCSPSMECVVSPDGSSTETWCLPPFGIPTAETMASSVTADVSPKHVVSSYSMAYIDFLSRMDFLFELVARFKLFKQERKWKIFRFYDAWNVGHPSSKAWYQPGLEARYDGQCIDSAAEVVTNRFPVPRSGADVVPPSVPDSSPHCAFGANSVCRYPEEASWWAAQPGTYQDPKWYATGNAGTVEEFLDWCTEDMKENTENPAANSDQDIVDSIVNTNQWGYDVGWEIWNSNQVCINGQVWTEWVGQAEQNIGDSQCKYVDPYTGVETIFPCADMNQAMLELWGCLNTSGSGFWSPVAMMLSYSNTVDTLTYVSPYTGQPAFLLSEIFVPVWSDGWSSGAGDLPPGGFELQLDAAYFIPGLQGQSWASSWLQKVAMCFEAHYWDPLYTRCECTTDADCYAVGLEASEQRRCTAGACEAWQQAPCQEPCENPVWGWLKMECPVAEMQGVKVGSCCGDGMLQTTPAEQQYVVNGQVMGYSEQCDDGNTVSGDGCSSGCQQEFGACCLVDGCAMLTLSQCVEKKGLFAGFGVACGEAACDQKQPCCLPSGECQEMPPAKCALYQGQVSSEATCEEAQCKPMGGICCSRSGLCTEVAVFTDFPSECLVANDLGLNTPFPPGMSVPCICTSDMESCVDGVCGLLWTGACCLPNGMCLELDLEKCLANKGVYQGPATNCDENVACGPVLGACCLASGGCLQTSQEGCSTAGGFWSGAYTTCGSFTCIQPGACCTDHGCIQTSIEKCSIEGGEFAGLGTSCNDTPPPCPGCTGADDCIDSNACTIDLCQNGVCTHQPMEGCCLSAADCADGNPCTVDFCTANHQCVYKYKINCCTTDAQCSDNNSCTLDWCDLETGDCLSEPVPDGTSCGMGKFACQDGVCGDIQ